MVCGNMSYSGTVGLKTFLYSSLSASKRFSSFLWMSATAGWWWVSAPLSLSRSLFPAPPLKYYVVSAVLTPVSSASYLRLYESYKSVSGYCICTNTYVMRTDSAQAEFFCLCWLMCSVIMQFPFHKMCLLYLTITSSCDLSCRTTRIPMAMRV